MSWSWSNIDWNGTGAMVQAVGSVAAIVAAIIIDQGTAKRLKAHQRRLDMAAGESRMVAILNAAEVLRTAAEELGESLTIDPRPPGATLSEASKDVLAASGRVLEYHLAQNVELNPGTLEGLALAQRIFSMEVARAAGNHPLRNVPTIASALLAAAGHLDDIAAEIGQETDRV